MKWFLIIALVQACFFIEAAERPNFVLIFIDDMGYGDIEPFGSAVNSTPNLNQMAAEGMRLTDFYAAPVCSASRAQLLTGCYAPRVSVPGVFFPQQPKGLNPAEYTVAEYLKEAGYATACIGKWHLGDQINFLPTRQGFDSYFGIPYSNDMQRTSIQTGKKVTPLLRDEKVIALLEDEGQRRVTREYTEEAVKFIRSNAGRENPFFLYLPHTAMHVPLYPHKDFVGKSKNGIYGDWVAEVDWSVGEILTAIDESNLSENTLVIFTSDNGPWASKGKAGGVSGPLRGSKGCTLEGGVRVPAIARWTGHIHAGTSTNTIIGTTDILPTFAALAGVELKTDRTIDGVDFTDVLTGEAERSSREAWYYFGGSTLQAVRQGPWKLAVAPQRIGMGFNIFHKDLKRTGRLYNLDREIGEMTDVSKDHPEMVAKLKALAASKAAEVERNKRPAGIAESPVMLYPSESSVRGTIEKIRKVVKAVNLGKAKSGDVISTNSVPNIAGKPFRISTTIAGENLSGPIIAHGGTSVGYVLYAKEGSLVFAVSDGQHIDRVTFPISDLSKPWMASVEEGKISITHGSKTIFAKSSLMKRHPQEDLSIGHDNKKRVDKAAPQGPFTGEIKSVSLEVVR